MPFGPRRRPGRGPSSPAVLACLLAAGGACIGAAFTGCGDPDGASTRPSKPATIFVDLTTLRPEEVSDVVALTGQLEAEMTGTVRSEVPGVIASIEFAEGQRVAAGDVLFRLKNAEQRARLMEAEAQMRLAQDVFDRTQTLASRDVSSIAREAEASARLDEARARVELARVELERSRILAPFAGVLGARTVALGDWVEEDEPLVQILAVDRLQAIFTVQEQGVPLAKVGLPVHVRVAAYPGERFPGEVFFVSPSLDPAARRLVMKAWIDNADGRLKPGMFVNVDVEIARVKEALMVAESAIVYDRNGIFVWRANAEGGAEKVPVELGIRKDGRVELVSGVSSGDRVVAAGTHKVLAGRPLSDPDHAPDTREEPGPKVHAQDAPSEGVAEGRS